MNLEEYKSIVKSTIEKCYPEYIWIDLFKYIEKNGKIRYDGRKTLKSGIIDISTFSNNTMKLEKLFEDLNDILKYCEQFEYERGYRYSSIYRYRNINFNKLTDLISQSKVKLYDINNEYIDELNYNFICPTIKYEGMKIYIKFSIRMRSKLENQNDIKYVVLGIINKENKTIEIRQDIIPIEYKNRDKFYEHNVKQVKSWLISLLEAQLDNVDLQAVTKYMKANKEDDVKVTALKLRRDGMTAELDSASNADFTLPILDELRNKIAREEIFQNNDTGKEIRNMLESFMSDIEENSDLPAAKILWLERNIKVNMYHGEVEGEVTFLKWIGELENKECMDYVTRYIIECEKEYRTQLED